MQSIQCAPEPEELSGLLSAREFEVLGLVAQGASNQQIAERLGLSVHTVKKHLSRVLLKLRVTSRSEAAALCHSRGHVAPPPAATRSSVAELTDRERDVLLRMASGVNNERIAADLALSLNTVKRHGTRIFSKLGVRSRVGAAAVLRHAAALG